MSTGGTIRVGIGGWSYDPWRTTFYPKEVPKTRELEYASRQLTAIEINSTFYRYQKPAVYAKWRDSTPAGFVFALKALQYVTNRKDLREAGESVQKFLNSGIAELGDRLGPINWQLAPTKTFDAAEIEGFLRLLPRTLGSLELRHVIEARHESFRCAQFIELLRNQGVAVVYTDAEKYPSLADRTADFVYARLMRSTSSEATGYPEPALAAWAQRASKWAQGQHPADLPLLMQAPAASTPRDVFIFFISAAKERNPAAATYLIAQLNSLEDGGTHAPSRSLATMQEDASR